MKKKKIAKMYYPNAESTDEKLIRRNLYLIRFNGILLVKWK